MKLNDFLEELKACEDNIISYEGKEALEAVKQDGNALVFVHNQTPEICLEAVKQNKGALEFVNKSVFTLEGREDMHDLKNMTPEEWLEIAPCSPSVLNDWLTGE